MVHRHHNPAQRRLSLRRPYLCLALVVGLLSSACAAERTPIPADAAQPSTTIAAAPEPFEEEPPAEIREWTPEAALTVLGDVCSQPIEGRGTLDDWTPKFWLLCNVVAVGPSGGVPDMWGFNAECVGDFLPGPDALSCIMDELVNYLIIDYQTWKLTHMAIPPGPGCWPRPKLSSGNGARRSCRVTGATMRPASVAPSICPRPRPLNQRRPQMPSQATRPALGQLPGIALSSRLSNPTMCSTSETSRWAASSRCLRSSGENSKTGCGCYAPTRRSPPTSKTMRL